MRYSKENVTLSRQSAQAYINSGFQPIPIPFGEKTPKIRNWNKLRITNDEAPTYFSSPCINIGILLGEPSRNLIDIDIDCVEAIALAGKLLPDTNFVFGHWSKPYSHYEYIVDTPPKNRKFTDIDGSVLLEIRSTNAQTLYPPSIHPSGEQIRYFKDGSPGNISVFKLLKSAQLLAAASLLTRHWPVEGARQNAALALAGGLLRTWKDPTKVSKFVYIVAKAAGDEETSKRINAVLDTAKKQNGKNKTTGWPTLGNILGNDTLEKVMCWLEIDNEPVLNDNRNNTFSFLSIEELKNLPPPEWLIENIFTVGGFVLLYGPAGDGKTFITIDLMLSIAQGIDWAGHATKSGIVAYIAAEGVGGLISRFKAWETYKSHSIDNIYTLPNPVQLTDQSDLDALDTALNELPQKPVLLAIDTMARCMAGKDENSAMDIGAMVKRLDDIRHKINCSILLNHHTGKDKRDERGSSALRGAADTVIRICKNGTKISLECEKQKDYSQFDDITFKLETIKLDDDPPNDSSCVLVPCNDKNIKNTVYLNNNKMAILKILKAEERGLKSSFLMQKFMDKTNKSNNTFYIAARELKREGYIVLDNNKQYCLTEIWLNTITTK